MLADQGWACSSTIGKSATRREESRCQAVTPADDEYRVLSVLCNTAMTLSSLVLKGSFFDVNRSWLIVPQVKDIMEDIEADMAARDQDDEEEDPTTTEKDSSGTGVLLSILSLFYGISYLP